MNLLFLGVCFLIPVIGPLVASGYYLRCFQAWHRGEIYPEFDFDYFMEYLKNGLWPFLCSLLVTLVSLPFVLVVILVPIVVMISSLQSDSSIAPGALLLLFAGMAVAFIIEAIVMLLLIPITIKSGVEQDFKAGFSLRFIKDFFRRVGGKLLVIEIAFFFVAIVAVFVGYLALIVGVYFAMAWLAFARWHAYSQLYSLYLERGGIELEFSEALSSIPANKLPPPPGGYQSPSYSDTPPPDEAPRLPSSEPPPNKDAPPQQ